MVSVGVSPSSSQPHSTPKIGTRYVVVDARAGPTRWISRKKSQYAMPVQSTPRALAASHDTAGIGVDGHVATANGATISVAQLSVPATPALGGRSASQCRVRLIATP